MLINYYFNKISKAPAQLSVLHVCGEIEKKKKKKKSKKDMFTSSKHVFINSDMALFFQQLLECVLFKDNYRYYLHNNFLYTVTRLDIYQSQVLVKVYMYF